MYNHCPSHLKGIFLKLTILLKTWSSNMLIFNPSLRLTPCLLPLQDSFLLDTCLGPRFWTLFVWGLSHNMLASIMVFREIEKFGNSSSLGVLFWFPVGWATAVSVSAGIFLFSFKKKNDKLKTLRWVFTM